MWCVCQPGFLRVKPQEGRGAGFPSSGEYAGVQGAGDDACSPHSVPAVWPGSRDAAGGTLLPRRPAGHLSGVHGTP